MTNFDPERYSIVVRKEPTESGQMYVARAVEFPDLKIYGTSHEEAYEGALETIETAKSVFDKRGEDFPEPEAISDADFSGRLPIRTTKTLHRALVANAQREGVSLNAYVNQLLTYGHATVMIRSELRAAIQESATQIVEEFDTHRALSSSSGGLYADANTSEDTNVH